MSNRFRIHCLALLALSLLGARSAEWIRSGLNTNALVWGVRGGLLVAIPPAGFRPANEGEPRGLIRLGFPTLPGGGYDLINFIAIEPVVKGRKGFSELEMSRLDGVRGKQFRIETNGNAAKLPDNGGSGHLTRLAPGVEQLEVLLRVEKFENGADVSLRLHQRSDAPDEWMFVVRAEPDSAPLEYCILTATMGNRARTRRLWLKDNRVSSGQMYGGYNQSGFARDSIYPLTQLHLSAAGDVLVAVTTDENDPASVFPFPKSELWHYGGRPVTQYWKKPRGSFREDLHARVNARYTYWQSSRAIPGGVAFENFELREKFYDGQQFVFGITFKTPHEMGLLQR